MRSSLLSTVCHHWSRARWQRRAGVGLWDWRSQDQLFHSSLSIAYWSIIVDILSGSQGFLGHHAPNSSMTLASERCLVLTGKLKAGNQFSPEKQIKTCKEIQQAVQTCPYKRLKDSSHFCICPELHPHSQTQWTSMHSPKSVTTCESNMRSEGSLLITWLRYSGSSQIGLPLNSSWLRKRIWCNSANTCRPHIRTLQIQCK